MADEETTEEKEETTDENVSEDANAEAAEGAVTDQSNDAGNEPDSPEFPDLKKGNGSNRVGDLNRFYDVQVTVSAELGRTSVPIQDLVGLSEGSVFELNRDVGAPIELIAQGVPLGNGEVVVVDDSFAIRIKEIYSDQS